MSLLINNYESFFKIATGKAPYEYQKKLANEQLPDIINLPTGFGKTAAVVLAWVWKRAIQKDEKTPRRLIYCLPTRSLVEQIRENIIEWLNNLNLLGGTLLGDINTKGTYSPNYNDPEKICVTTIMGGEYDNEWELYPERNAIIIGTQDMLLSRALNRGYGMSRYKWPIDFGLLNNDCLWVMDEIQLMGVGAQTTAQMDSFRNEIGSFFSNTKSIWMSATFYDKMIETVDHNQKKLSTSWNKLSIDPTNMSTELKNIYNAKKINEKAIIKLTKDKQNYTEEVAKLILDKHKEGTLTLCIVNNVKRAQDIYRNILKLDKNRNDDNTTLLHSRFREKDRIKKMKILFEGRNKDKIIISTQVIEAGIDVSSRVMVTELAPWPSFVQRIGRCNRFGEYDDAEVIWIDIDNDQDMLPYQKEEMENSRKLINQLSDVSPQKLNGYSYEPPKLPYHIIRKKDIIDLFDTTPDLTGYDIDVSNYIRSDNDKDVYVFWRDIDIENIDEQASPSKEELCGVPISDIRKYIKKYDAWYWDHISGKWEKISNNNDYPIRPGQVIMLNSKFGGYTNELGWVVDSKEPVDVVLLNKKDAEDSMNDDSESCIGEWIPLLEHTSHVKSEVKWLSNVLFNKNNNGSINNALELAAHWHDVGKAHEAFQNMLKNIDGDPPQKDEVWGKASRESKKPKYIDSKSNERLYFRHELASALAWLKHSKTIVNNKEDMYLVAYLIASHHGKIRLSIRSIPNEKIPQNNKLFARGVWEDDIIPTIKGLTEENIQLDSSILSIVKLGNDSWLENMIYIRDKYGIFKLAYLESILRIADWRSSKKEREGRYKNEQSQ